MQSIQWQLFVAGEPVQPGANLRVNEKWQNAAGAYVVLQPAEKEKTSTFCVRYNVNIGGKDYLLLEDAHSPEGELTIVRCFSAERFGAMDPDRFSSLRNALIDFLQSEVPTKIEVLDKLLGGLEAR
ncbi:MAG TPA: hypothetical protein EYN91_09410 [Candidatus Melainabacteria bacterium]|jgi:hypothetical protein|nr:hypothetical protein [Candidatus Melainabacteria bacterium]HIN66266.1 hypothetical protein [Candidatus Obscuribacterales bacterium]